MSRATGTALERIQADLWPAGPAAERAAVDDGRPFGRDGWGDFETVDTIVFLCAMAECRQVVGGYTGTGTLDQALARDACRGRFHD